MNFDFNQLREDFIILIFHHSIDLSFKEKKTIENLMGELFNTIQKRILQQKIV